MKLLIADDEQKIRVGMASLDWDSIGITEVSLTVNGVEAKKLLEQEPFDIMICDIKMPGLTGLELAAYVQEHTLDTSVILLSGFSDFEYARTAMKHNVCDYMLKPLRPKDILETVKHAMENLERKRYKERVVRDYETAFSSPDFTEQIRWNFHGINEQIMEILMYLSQHFDEAITLSILADQYYFSTAYLSRMIKKETGYSFSEILLSIRLAAAVRLLSGKQHKNSYIADKIGFSDYKYFSQVFKKVFGCKPAEFRKQQDSEKRYSIRSILELIETSDKDSI